jgi:hypothetical protein
MMNEKLLYKILRYSAQAAIVYLIFRYFPGSKLQTTQSLVATLIILVLSIIIERLCVSYLINSNNDNAQEEASVLEKFDASQKCATCKIEKFDNNEKDATPPEPKQIEPMNSNKKCRVVCDSTPNDSKESFENSKSVNGQNGNEQNGNGQNGNEQNGNEQNGNEQNGNGQNGNGQNGNGQNGNGQDNSSKGVEEAVVVDGTATAASAASVSNGGPPANVSYDELRTMRRDVADETGQIVNDNKSTDSDISASTNDDRFYWGTRYGNLGYDDRYGFGGMFYDEYPFYNRFRNNDLSNIKDNGEYYTDRGANDAYRMRKEQANVQYRKDRLEERAREIGGYDSRFQEVGSKSERNKTTESRRRIEGELDDEIPYTDYNHLPIAAGYKSHDYEYGYSFLPPEKWYPQPPRAPICVSEKRCPTMPVYAHGTPMDVKEFHSARRITPPDLINTDYIGDKLNSGR